MIFWFEKNFMKLNTDKCHLLLSGTKYELSSPKTGNDKIWESKGVTTDNKFKFDDHTANTCFKAIQKLSALSRLARLLTFDGKPSFFKAFFEYHLKYCSLFWVFCSRRANNRINKLHERALRLAYDDCETSFSDLLPINCSFTVHHTNI